MMPALISSRTIGPGEKRIAHNRPVDSVDDSYKDNDSYALNKLSEDFSQDSSFIARSKPFLPSSSLNSGSSRSFLIA
jgi:hypothetical protein